MKRVLIFSDSLCYELPTVDEAGIAFYVQAFPGTTAREWVAQENETEGFFSLSDLLAEDDYSTVVLCFGTNDLGHGESVEDTARNVCALQKICSDKGVQQIITILLRETSANKIRFNKLLDRDSVDPVILCDFFLALTEDDFTDGLHLTSDAKLRLFEHLRSLAKEVVDQ